MHSNSQPDPEDRQITLPPSRAVAVLDPDRAELIDRLNKAREEDSLSTNRLARQLGYSPSVLSQYLDNKYPGDVAAVDKRAADWLRRREQIRKGGLRIIESDVTRSVWSALETIRRTNDVGLIHGPAGAGKTCGLLHYAQSNPTVLMITLDRWARNDAQIEGLVLGQMDSRSWPGNTPRSQFIAERLVGSGRLLIVDNAHKATASGIEWLFDMHDRTEIPIALCGNPEVLRHIERNDQRFSRIGLVTEVKVKNAKPLVQHILRSVAPGLGADADDLGEQVAEHRGLFRAVKKQASLAAQIQEAAHCSPADAFRGAHKRLVRDYALV